MLTRDILHNKSVVVSVFKDAKYNTVPPYHPQRLYPEYPFGEKNINTGDDGNPDAYESTREIFRMLEYDEEHYDTKEWNPLGVIIKQGQNVVIKPNFVLHLNEGGYDIFANLTHPSVIRALIDYTYIALKGQGTITIAEAPQMDCEFEVIEQIMHLQAIVDFYNQTLNFPITILDIRRLKCKRDPVKKYYPAESFIYNDNADPQGYAIVNLGSLSMLDELDGIDGLYGSDYDRSFTSENHHKGVHRYCISKTFLNADTVILVPKMKTHKKVGVTLLMKLLVGINGDKNFLAHYRVGPPSKKGDEFPDTKFKNVAFTRKVLRFISDKLLTKRNKFSDVLWLIARGVGKPFLTFLQEAGLIKKPEISDQIMNGNWYGNDTAWRMAIDLARIALFTDKEGIVTVSPQRNVFAIVDGIVAGEGDGPMSSEPLQAGILVAGENILAVDSVTTTVMGFDWKKIRMIKNAWELATHRLAEFPIDAITIHSNDSALDGKNASNCRKFCFRPHRHWIGTIELE